ncbi:unnamed protein product [Rotaria socialis]|nr:unnamed protein product [Rotaria socialis]
MCSGVFIAGRNEGLKEKDDLPSDLMKYATVTIDHKDLSASSSFFGLAHSKAIYRPGLGATLIHELTEKEIRAQKFNLTSPPDVNQDDIPWPMGDKTDHYSIPSNINRTLLQDAISSLFIEKDRKKLINTRAVVVVYDGKLIAEQYARSWPRTSKHLGWSMTKSIISALFGIVAQEKNLDINGPAPVSEWNESDDPRHSITIKDLLQQTSGLNFVEDYTSSSDALKMLYLTSNMAKNAASHALGDKPGTQFSYSSGNTNILSRIIRDIVGENEYHSFPYRKLFYKLGMNSFIMEVDASGTFVGSSYSYGTARDWARFGLLYLSNGLYNNEQILSKDWIEQTIKSSGANRGYRYGFQFWLNNPVSDDSSERRFPNAPTDMYYASGNLGQNVFIIPSKKLAIVRLGATKTPGSDYGADDFLKTVIASIE